MITGELRMKVFIRDATMIWTHSEERLIRRWSLRRFMTKRWHRSLCLVELLDPPESVNCRGRWTLEHVKDHLMMGKKAPDDEWHLVVLCRYHNVDHPPSKELRAKIRAYLADQRAAASE